MHPSNNMRLVLALLLCVILSACIADAASTESVAIDWPAFLSRSDMVWNALPTRWENAPFVGNGCLGTIFWKNQAGALHFEVSRGDLYDHRRYDALLGRCRLPNGHFKLNFPGKDPQGTMRLDLWNAEVKGRITTDQGEWNLRCFTASESDVIVLEIEGSPEPAMTWHADPAKSTRDRRVPEALKPYPPQVEREIDGVPVSVQEMPEDRLYHTDGMGVGQYATAWNLVRPREGHNVYFISTQISYPGATAAARAVEVAKKAEKSGLAAVEERHRAWWHAYYPRSFLSVPDARIESFYWIQMYKMGSAVRKKGPLLDLMGPWFRPTVWPAIWWNLNIQLSYWPFYVSNHIESAETLSDAVWDHRDALAKNAGKYQADSYAIGRASGPDCRSAVGSEAGNLPWVMHNLWMQYRSTMDDRFLADRLFPLMKGSFRYLRHILVRQPDGKLAMPATASPEYTLAVENCTYTMACLRWTAAALIAADARLKTNDPVIAECRDVLDNLVPYEIDPASGFMVGKGMPFVKTHRHWSHLFPIYPFHEYVWENPLQQPVIERSIKNWTDKPGGFAGYSWLGAASMMAAGGKGDEALDYLHIFLKKSPLPNTLYVESGPVIETPLAFARCVQELLMTSHGDCIRIFPGTPSKWAEASFSTFRAEGAFLVSARREGGVTQFVKVHSLAGEPCRIRTGLAGTVKALIDGKTAEVKDLGGGITEVKLAKGETGVLYSGQRPPKLDLPPVSISERLTPWGESMPKEL